MEGTTLRVAKSEGCRMDEPTSDASIAQDRPKGIPPRVTLGATSQREPRDCRGSPGHRGKRRPGLVSGMVHVVHADQQKCASARRESSHLSCPPRLSWSKNEDRRTLLNLTDPADAGSANTVSVEKHENEFGHRVWVMLSTWPSQGWQQAGGCIGMKTT